MALLGLGPNPQHLELLLERARGGDAGSREALLRAYRPFVMRVASQFCGRFLRLGEDEEAQVALEAFNEAVDSFDPSAGAPFPAFARTVMKRRLIDDLRRKQRQAREVPLSAFDEEDDEGGVRNTVDAAGAVAEYERTQENMERRDEVLRYRELLSGYGISLRELVELTPKHEDARRRAIEVARVVADDPALRDHLRRKKELPLRELEGRVDLSRKTLERQRKYIIAVALVYAGEFTSLRSYLDRPEPGGSEGGRTG